MSDTIEERACLLAVYIIETGATVRATAQHFGISKYNPVLFSQVRKILELNKAQRHIRGGLATRRKYKGES